MKRALTYAAVVLAVLFAAGQALADELAVNYTVNFTADIPGKHAFAIVKGYDASVLAAEQDAENLLKSAVAQLGVEQAQIAFYGVGDNAGRVVAMAMMDNGRYTFGRLDETDPNLTTEERLSLLAYRVEPGVLWNAYSSNEPASDALYRGRNLLMRLRVDEVSKGMDGEPYICSNLGTQMARLQVALPKDNPKTAKVQTGQEVVVAAKPGNFLGEMLFLDGRVLYIN